MKIEKEAEGIIFGALSYLIWGIVPIYWKLIDHVDAWEILIHRVLWSFVFMVAVLWASRKWAVFMQYCKEIWANKKKLLALFGASILVTANWGIFIWAVNEGRILETSLGYYINPLVSVLLGVVVLKEKLTKIQVVSVCLAAIGVAVLTFYLGSLPWVSLCLALSFGFYGLTKVMINAEAAIGLTLETLLMVPAGIIFLSFLVNEQGSTAVTVQDMLLLAGGGVVTALPLLLFAMGARNIPLSMLGFLQYIAPTLSLLIGVFLYHEQFTAAHGIAFSFIWCGLILYSFAQVKSINKNKRRFQPNNEEAKVH